MAVLGLGAKKAVQNDSQDVPSQGDDAKQSLAQVENKEQDVDKCMFC